MATVTISRQFGAGGRSLAERLCKRFGFQLIDEFKTDELAKRAKIRGDWLQAVEKEACSTILNIISTVVSSGFGYKNPSVPAEDYDRKRYVDFLKKVMTTIANEGNCVILGRGAQFVLKNHPKAFHLLLVAEYEDRLRFIMNNYNLSKEDAARIISDKEKQRSAIANIIFNEDIDNPKHYHLVVNTSRIPFEYAADCVTDLVSKFFSLQHG